MGGQQQFSSGGISAGGVGTGVGESLTRIDAGWARVLWAAAVGPSATANLNILRGVREGTAVLDGDATSQGLSVRRSIAISKVL